MEEIARHPEITLMWVPGHRDIIASQTEHLRFTAGYQHTNDCVQEADIPNILFGSTGQIETHMLGDQENLTLNKSQALCSGPETTKSTIKEPQWCN